MIDVNKLKAFLVEKYDYPAFMAEKTIDKVEKLDPLIYQEFERWLDSGEEPRTEIEGYSVKKLINKYKMNEVGAFLTLDWLKREPDEAKKALSRGVK
jgi:hypothetical protein